MALTPLISPIMCNRIAYFPPLFFSLACKSYKLSPSRKLHKNAYSYCQSLPLFSYQSLAPSCLYYLTRRAIPTIACETNNSASEEEDDNQALEKCTPINNKNSQESFEIFGVEPPCVCNLVSSFFQASQVEKQVLDFLSYLRNIMEKNFKIVVKQSLDDGVAVGVKWRFEWKRIHAPTGKGFRHAPTGKGFSFHISQTYQGKAMIRNIEMFIKPLLQLEPFRLGVMAYYVALMGRMGSLMSPKFEAKRTEIFCLVLPLLSLAVLLCLRVVSNRSMS